MRYFVTVNPSHMRYINLHLHYITLGIWHVTLSRHTSSKQMTVFVDKDYCVNDVWWWASFAI